MYIMSIINETLLIAEWNYQTHLNGQKFSFHCDSAMKIMHNFPGLDIWLYLI